MTTYAKLMNHMVEAARQKDIIAKLKTLLIKKSQEIKGMRRQLQHHNSVRNPLGFIENGVNEESESEQNDTQEIDQRVSYR